MYRAVVRFLFRCLRFIQNASIALFINNKHEAKLTHQAINFCCFLPVSTVASCGKLRGFAFIDAFFGCLLRYAIYFAQGS